ncbi:MAG TPA: hypothetical protein VKZ53_00550 [Candidatus Angelobacter sp.]|nr:hypothetical protein [Candidatus Angelobacter sp.]
MIAVGQAFAGAIALLYFYLGGVGVREHSRFAAAAVFLLYALELFSPNFGVVRVMISAILLSNLRATWIAAGWNPASEEASLPQRMGNSLADKFTDRLPSWLWPKIRILYYIFAPCVMMLFILGLTLKLGLALRGSH